MARPARPGGMLTTAYLDWFDDGCCDVLYLDLWQDSPLSYVTGQGSNAGWRSFHRHLALGQDGSGETFERAADRLMRYQFYPPHILSAIGEFDLGYARPMQPGDRIVHRIHLLRLFGINVLDAITMVEVVKADRNPHRLLIELASVIPHVQQGACTFRLTRQPDNNVKLDVDVLSRPDPTEPGRNHRLIDRLQNRAIEAGLNHLRSSLLT